MWRLNRERLGFLVLREIKSRYKDTTLGLVWVIITPIIQAFVISFFLVKIIGLSAPSIPTQQMPLVVLSGLILWNFVSRSFAQAMSTFSGRRELIINQPLPLILLPLSDSLTKLFDFVVDTLVLVIMSWIVIGHLGWSLLALIPFTLILWIFGAALALLSSLIEVVVRDVGHLVSFFLSIWFWFSPIFYPAEIIPVHYRFINLNPLVHFLAAYRQIILGQTVDIEKMAKLIVMSTVIGLFSWWVFRRYQKRIYEVE